MDKQGAVKQIFLPSFGLDNAAERDESQREQKTISYSVPVVDDRKLVAITLLINPDSGQIHGVGAQPACKVPPYDDMLVMVEVCVRRTKDEVLAFFKEP